MTDKTINDFAKTFLNAKTDKFTINNITFDVKKGIKCSINNQGGSLAEENYFGRHHEYTVIGDNYEIPICLQLYENNRGFFRVFVFSKKGMLTSINLSTGFNDDVINLIIKIKISTVNMPAEERKINKNKLLSVLENEDFNIITKDVVFFGLYDTIRNNYIKTTKDKFLHDLIKLAIIKGHFMGNKGYKLNCIE